MKRVRGAASVLRRPNRNPDVNKEGEMTVITVTIDLEDPGESLTDADVLEWLRYVYRDTSSMRADLPVDEEPRPRWLSISRGGRTLR